MKKLLVLTMAMLIFCTLVDLSRAEVQIRKGASDKELRQNIKEGRAEERAASNTMTKQYKEEIASQGELNRAKKGDVSMKDVIRYGAVRTLSEDQDTRINRAQERYDKAKESYDATKDKWSDAIYKQGASKIYLQRREESRKKQSK